MRLIYTIFIFILFGINQGNGQCNFTVSSTSVCGLAPVNFQVINPSGTYTWDFDGDGNIDADGADVTYSFPQVNFATPFSVAMFQNGNFCSAQNIIVLQTPDPSIGVLPGSGILEGTNIRTCSSLPNITLDIYNASSTYAWNVGYTIDWGDGTVENFNNTTFPGTNFISHDFNGFGYYDISITVETSNGCTNTQVYSFYNGGNPSVGLATPGNTTGLCAPATVDFPITNTANNPAGTIYNVYVSGELVTTYTQDNVPSDFTYTFLESSCGLNTSTGNYQNAYDVQIEATNPCGSSQATIEPIEVSTPPELIFSVLEPANSCDGEEYTFSNETGGFGEVISGNPSTCSSLTPSWNVSPGLPGIDWDIITGNVFGADEITVVFYTPGVYTITMSISSPSCGDGVFSQDVEVLSGPSTSAVANLVTAASPGAMECVETLATFDNESEGDSLSYVWSISPASGWDFIDTSSTTTEDIIVNFTQAGDYTVSLTATNFCGSETWDTILNIVAAPEITLYPINDFCENATLNFDASNVNLNANNGTFSSIEWSFPGASPSTFSGSYPTGIYYNSPGTYTVTVTGANQCGQATSTQTFTVQEPGMLDIMDDQTVCQNGTPFMLTAIPAGGTWSGTGVSANGLFDPSTANIGNNILTYNYQDNNCVMQGNVIVTVTSLIEVDAGTDQEACVTAPVFVIAEGSPIGGIWTVDNGGVITGNNTFDPTASGAGTFTLTYTFTEVNSCSNSDTKIITIHDLPNVDAGLDQAICENPNDITLTGYTPAGGTWTGFGVTSNGIFNAGNTTGLGDYILYYSYTDPSTGCTNTDSKIISVVPNSIADAGADEEVCVNGASFTITTGTPTGGIWSGNGITTGTNIFDPAVVGVGTHVVTYTYGVGVCETSDTKIITVIDLPNITLPNIDDACINGALVDLNGAIPAGGTWNGTAVTGTNFNPIDAGIGTHTLTYSYTNPTTQCSNTASFEIEVFGLPTLVVNDSSYCNTPGLVDLPLGNPTGGTWSGTGVFGNQFDPIVAGGVGTYTPTYTYTDGNGCENSTTISVTVGAPENVNAGNDFEICLDAEIIDLSQMATPAGGTWNSNGSAGLNGNNFNPFTAGEGVHTLTYSFGSGNCMISDEVEITIYGLPEVIAMDDFEICESQSSVILNATPSGGIWTSNNGGILGGNIFNATATGEGNFSFTYTYTDANGCTNSDDLIITVFPLPIMTSSDTTYCNTVGWVTLPYSTPVGGTWNGIGVGNNQFDPTIAGGVGSYDLIYSFTDGNGCTNNIISTITVTDAQTIDAGDDLEICEDYGIINLEVLSSPPGGNWISNGSSGLVGNTFDPTLAGEGIHTLTYTIGTANCQVWDDVIIEVHELPYVDAGQDREVCFGEPNLDLVGFPAGGTWNGAGIIDAQNGIFFSSTPAGDYTLTYSFTDSYGCENSDSIQVTVHPLPEVDAGNDTTFCAQPYNVVLNSATPSGGIWSGIGIVDATNGVFNAANSGGLGDFEVVYTFENPTTGCDQSDTIIVTIVEPQNVEAGANDTLCIDQGNYQLVGYVPSNGTWSGNGIIDAANGIFDPTVAGGGLHTLTYTFGNGSCFVEDSKTILVVDLSFVNAGPDVSTCVTYEPITLTGQNPINGIWSGVGIVDAVNGIFDPSIAQVGDHVLTYTYTDPLSDCIFSDEKIMTVFPMEIPAFDMPELACRNEVITFQNFSPNDYAVTWNFGDGATSTQFAPTHAYDVVGKYQVSLEVENTHGCVEMVFDSILITDIPVAFFEPDTTEACVGIELNLTNLSFGENLTYLWNFGDNQTSTEENPGLLYFENGINDTAYIITLTVTNQCGSATYQDVITVHPQPVANIGLVELTDCSPLLVDFANISTGAATEFYWDFGNGETSTELIPQQQTFVADDTIETYLVTLISSNECGSDTATTEVVVIPPDVKAISGASQLAGCQPLVVDFYNYSTPGATIDWDFGDGNLSSSETPTHTFTEVGEYTVIQYASSDCGYDTTTLKINVYPAPEVAFSHPSFACVNQPIFFENTSISVSGSLWDFGDGDTSLLTSPEHIYTTSGEYTVTLTSVSFHNQCPASYTKVITVMDVPTVTFDPSVFNGCVPLEIEMTNTSPNTLFFDWEFGDGNTSIEENPTHVYHEVGTYEITFTATDINGCFNDTTISNVIVHPRATAGFDFERASLCGLPAEINFENQSIGATGFTWNFDNGQTTHNNDPTNFYTEAGTYDVELFATNQFNCPDTISEELVIYPEPNADFEIANMEGCQPLDVSFNNTSTNSNSYHWNFGNGYTSTESSPSILYTQDGLYDVQLIVSVNNTCYDTLLLNEAIDVHITPFANFDIEEAQTGIYDGSYQMINLSEDADTYYWEFSDGATSDIRNPIHRFFNNGNKQVYLEVSTEFGCVDDTLINFIPQPITGLFVPNAFSPEQGIGDVRVFKPAGVGLKEYHIQIFSPYGQLLWESKELADGQPAEAWDGRLRGKLLPQDVYVWKIKAIHEDGTAWRGVPKKNGGFKTMGSVTLLR